MTERDPFKKIVLPCIDHLHDVARSMVRDRSRTGDLVMETLIAARDRYEDEPSRENVRSWLREIMESVWWHQFRDKGRPAESPDRPDPLPSRNFTPVAGSEEVPDGMERMSRDDVRTALLSMPAAYRRVLILSSMDDVDEVEAADRLGVSPVVLRSRFVRAKQLLKERLRNPRFRMEPFRGKDEER